MSHLRTWLSEHTRSNDAQKEVASQFPTSHRFQKAAVPFCGQPCTLPPGLETWRIHLGLAAG